MPLALILVLILAAPAAAQTNGPPEGGPHQQQGGPRLDRPPASVEVLFGHAGFADDATIEHTVFGGAARAYVTPRLSVGPEFTYMNGPGSDHDLFILGNLTFDLRHPRAGRPPRVSPFLIAGGGFSTTTLPIGIGTYTSSEGAFALGGGTRVHVNDRVYAMVDFRIGWELHYRVTGGVGLSLRQ